jgi:hypothetical protein
MSPLEIQTAGLLGWPIGVIPQIGVFRLPHPHEEHDVPHSGPHSGNVTLAAIRYTRGLDVDALLLEACDALRARGLRLGGVIQRASGGLGACSTSVRVVDLRSGEAYDIWEERGACASGCRLDERGLIDAEATIKATIADGVDLVVLNRFGRSESLGRGLTGCFAAAIDAGVPVLTAVRAPYDEAWRAFHGGLGQDLPADREQVTGWALRATECLLASPAGTLQAAAPPTGPDAKTGTPPG